MYKFLNRLWRQVYDLVGEAGEDTLYQAAGKKSAKELAEELNRERHRLVGKVVEDVERNNFNTGDRRYHGAFERGRQLPARSFC